MKNHFFISLFIFFIILNSCKLQEPSKNHGIVFLENRSKKLIINTTNKNDVIKIIGQPHSTSINNDDQWIYIERILTKGEYLKLGRNVLKANNVLILNFDKYGILNEKIFLDKNDKKYVKFSNQNTESEKSKRSFVEKFLSSVKTKMYGNR